MKFEGNRWCLIVNFVKIRVTIMIHKTTRIYFGRPLVLQRYNNEYKNKNFPD